MQTIKRVTAMLLVLTLMLSCFPMAARASALTTTDPTSTTAATAETTAPTSVPVEPTVSTEPVAETTEATDPVLETTEATEPAAEATGSTEKNIPVVNELVSGIAERNVSIRFTLPSDVPANTELTTVEGSPVDAQMQAIMSQFNIQNVLDYFVWDLAADMDITGSLRADIAFRTPYLKAVSPAGVALFLVSGNDQIAKLPADVRISPEKNITSITASFDGFSHAVRLICISEDSPAVESNSGGGFANYSSQYRVSASYGRYPGIGDADGALTYHCWSASGNYSPAKPAICLDSDRLFGSGDGSWHFGWCTSSNTSDDEGPTSSWKDLSKSTRDKLVLLCAYGLSEWSPVGKYRDIQGGNAFAAMQLVAWEWINRVDEGTYTSRYNETVQSIADGMRSYVQNNPDHVDPEKSSVYVIWPNSQKLYNGRYVWGQTLIALWGVEYKDSTGALTVTKAVKGSGSTANWRMELYASQAAANSGTGYIASAYTDANGIATFKDLNVGTYYVREAPAFRQDRVNVTGWTLSTEVKSGKISAGSTTSAGTITNTAPVGAITVKKGLASASPSGKLSGWIFQVSRNASFSSVVSTITTDAKGEGSTRKVLSPGTYYVREAPLANQTRGDKNNFTLDKNVVTVTIKGSETVLADNGTGVTANNIELSAITIKKTVSSVDPSGKLENWVFQIASDAKFSGIIKTLTTDKNGFASTGKVLSPGTYYVREAPLASQTRSDKNDYILDTDTVVTVTLQAGETKAALHTADATAVNVEKGMIRIRKGVAGADQTADKLQGWIFQISASEDFSTILSSVTTGADGYAVSVKLDPGTYYVREAPVENQSRKDKSMWSQDNTPVTVVVTAGSTVDALNGDGYTAVNAYGKRLTIQKAAQCDQETAAQLEGNAMYSLAGAEYNVVVDGSIVETLVTDDTGKAVSKEAYPIGTTGTLVEITAPSGYVLDATPVPFTIPAGSDEYVVEVSDAPTFDPGLVSIKKVDAVTGTPAGNATFEGAVFRWDYYDNTTCTGTPTRTWYFAADSTGRHRCNPQYFADSAEYPSDELYRNYETGVYEHPLGSVKITEISAPLGYDVMPVLTATITQENNGEIAIWKWSKESIAYLTEIADGVSVPEPQDEDSFGSLSIRKADKDLGTEIPEGVSLAGCEFTVYNRSAGAVKIGDNPIAQPGEVCCTLTVDASGTVSTGNIFPVGSYEVKETKGNDYYSVNEAWSYSFSVVEGKTEFAAECVNTQIPVTIRVEKVNAEGAALEGARFILEWSEDGQTWQPVAHDTQIAKGSCSSPDLAEDGSLVTDESGKIEFAGLYPLLTYRIIEAATPNGYSLLSDPIIVDTPTYERGYEVSYKVVDGHVFALPKTGAADMPLLSVGIALALAVGMIALAYWKKKEN